MSTMTQPATPGFTIETEVPASARDVKPLQDLEVAVSVKNVNLFYGEKQALHEVSLNIPRGHVVAFIGPSGCGKSTLLRCFNRMNDLVDHCRVEGEIQIDGKNIYDRSVNVAQLRRRVGMVFQKPNPFPKTIYENVAYGLVIARAVALEPEVLLLDEPCSALDPISTAKVEELLHELKHKYTIVIVTHNMQQAARVSDFTAYMYLGKLIEYSPTRELFMKPARRETEDYITGRFG